MKYSPRILSSLMLLGSLVLSSCAGGNSYIQLPYSTGMGDNSVFDSDRFFYNGVKYSAADPGAIYVPKERDSTYGGYCYAYFTGDMNDSDYSKVTSETIEKTYGKDAHVIGLAIQCYRTKDFVNWEEAGSELNGFSLVMHDDDFIDWHAHRMWAPEVIYDEVTNKYYMYFTSACRIYEEGSIGYTSESIISERMTIATAVSDTPAGPFIIKNNVEVLSDDTTQNIPYINFKKEFGLDHEVGMIDVSPFKDDDGSLYLYFKTESGDTERNLYCMKMINFYEPDFSTLTCVAMCGKETVSSPSGKNSLVAANLQAGSSFQDGYLLEAPHVIKHNSRYYLTFSVNGYNDPGYSVYQAVSSYPNHGFTKVSLEAANPILSGIGQEFSRGTGHHSFVSVGNVNYVIYHAHANPSSMSGAWNRRCLMTDTYNFYDVGLDYDVIMCNGPSKSLQPLATDISGLKNIALDAEIKVDNGEGKEYLTDGLYPYYDYNANRQFKAEGDVNIKFSFSEPKTLNTVMVHTSSDIFTAFSKIDYVLFELAETITYNGKEYLNAAIKDLVFPAKYLKDGDNSFIVYCAPAVATFEDIKVKSVTIVVYEDSRIQKENKLGEKNTVLELSEIVLLGR